MKNKKGILSWGILIIIILIVLILLFSGILNLGSIVTFGSIKTSTIASKEETNYQNFIISWSEAQTEKRATAPVKVKDSIITSSDDASIAVYLNFKAGTNNPTETPSGLQEGVYFDAYNVIIPAILIINPDSDSEYTEQTKVRILKAKCKMVQAGGGREQSGQKRYYNKMKFTCPIEGEVKCPEGKECKISVANSGSLTARIYKTGFYPPEATDIETGETIIEDRDLDGDIDEDDRVEPTPEELGDRIETPSIQKPVTKTLNWFDDFIFKILNWFKGLFK